MPLIDRHLPQYQFVERHALWVPASPRILLDCAVDTALADDPFITRLITLREWPARLMARCGLPSTLPARPFGLADFTPLGREGDKEIAFGLAGRFWQADYGLVPIQDTHALTNNRDPALAGVTRLALNFTAQACANGSTLLGTETRVYCPDSASRRRFAPYWLLVRPVSGMIRRRLLRRIGAAAQSEAHRLSGPQ